MFIYRVWALFIVASVSAASSSKNASTAKIPGSTSAKIERRTSVLQHMASQPVPMASPMSPQHPFAGFSTMGIAAMYSVSAPTGRARPMSITSPSRVELPGFGSLIDVEEELQFSQSVRMPHLKSTRRGRVDELLQSREDRAEFDREKSILLQQTDACAQSPYAELDSVTAAGSDEDYFEEVALHSDDDLNF